MGLTNDSVLGFLSSVQEPDATKPDLQIIYQSQQKSEN